MASKLYGLVTTGAFAYASNMLDSLGHVVCGPAASLSAAEELARTDTFDVALLDINVAGKMSLDFARNLIGKNVPVAFMTGYGDTVLGDFADVPVLQKPYNFSQLQAIVERLSDQMRGIAK